MNFAKFLRTPFLQKTPGRLLLLFEQSKKQDYLLFEILKITPLRCLNFNFFNFIYVQGTRGYIEKKIHIIFRNYFVLLAISTLN